MPPKPQLSLIQRVINARRPSRIAPPQPHRAVAPARAYLVLDLVADKQSSPPDPAEPPTLLGGHDYSVRVSASTDGTPGQATIVVKAALELWLKSSNPMIALQHCTVAWPGADEFSHQFSFALPAELPSTDVTLQLFCREAGTNYHPLLACSLVVRMAGTFFPPTEPLLAQTRISLDTHLPDNVAVLYVEAPEPEKLQISGWNYRQQPIHTGRIEKPEVGLADFVEGQVPPQTVRDSLRNFSRRNPSQLITWLKRLIDRYGDDFSLVISDHTDVEVPWEMVELHDNVYLGTKVKVARWIPVQFYDEWIRLRVDKQAAPVGRVLAYLDAGLGEEALMLERSALNKLKHTDCPDLDALRGHLSKQLRDVQLVFIGSHGIFMENDKRKTALGDLAGSDRPLIALDLEGVGKQEEPRPLVFVNACHSGRLMRDANGLFGLPEVFLARLASGYIGTTGPVGITHASSIAADFLYAAGRPEGIAPAEWLRIARQRAADRVKEQPSKDDWFLFIYTFMYVYYGNPEADVRLAEVQ